MVSINAAFSEEDAKILERHVSSMDGSVYAIYNLPPEVVAVLFAYVSRSPASFRQNLLKLLKEKDLDVGSLVDGYSAKGMDYGAASEKARKFHERWVVGYGHGSVAEHAVAHIALEDVSILASKVIEDNRLASYTEKSTRYQVFDRGRYHKPGNLMKSPLGRVYAETCDSLFDFYTASFPGMLSFMKKKHPKPSDMPDALYENVTKARACDVLRYALPAATYTSIGMTANARILERAISKLLSHPLAEMNDIGAKAKEEVRKVIPTLVKYADRNAYMSGMDAAMEKLPVMRGGRKKKGGRLVTLVSYDHDAEDRVLSSVIYRYSDMTHKEALSLVRSFGRAKNSALLESLFAGRGKFDSVPRELENAYYTFDVLVDYGAFRDIQRHRICTQVNQDVTTAHGYDVPQELKEAGLDRKFTDLMEKADGAFRKISRKFPKEAQYVVPLAYRKRVLMTMNLRELHHFISLRSGREGHISYRKVAWEMYDEIAKVHPVLAKYIRVDRSDGPSR